MKILFAIHGSHSQPEQMQAQRETWLQDIAGPSPIRLVWQLYGIEVHYRYFLGLPFGNDADVEYLNLPDGPLWEGHRRTLVLNDKTETICRYGFINGYDYVFKCDDDTYVWTDRLLNCGFSGLDYFGHLDIHYAPDIGYYQWAQGGAGYWLSRKAMQIIADNGLRDTARAEDFAVGHVLARHRIKPWHSNIFHPAVTADDVANPSPNAFSFHKIDPESMRSLHSR